MNVGVIGAGASGLMASYVAAKSGHSVTLFEHMNKAGKKILATGGGKCNLSNTDMNLSHFHGDSEFISAVMSQASREEVLALFDEMGLITGERNGYIYPYNEQAVTVVDVLQLSCEHFGVKIIYETDVLEVIRCCDGEKDSLRVISDKGEYTFEKVILCSGSKAYPKTGSNGSGYDIAQKLGHDVIKPLPALCALRCGEKYFKTLQGVRCKADVSVYANGNKIGFESGELQLTSYGLSGIPAMQLSYLVSKSLDRGQEVFAHISFLKDMCFDDIKALILKRVEYNPAVDAYKMLLGTVNKNIIPVILQQSNISSEKIAGELSENEIERLAKSLSDFAVRIIGTNSFDESQICCGGVNTDEVDISLESKLCKGLFFAGEILDVNGDCGGYNLQWAFSTGAIAGGFKNA